MSVTQLHLDSANPRLPRDAAVRSNRDVIHHLFNHDKALDIARSIATRGFFPNEPLLAVKEGDRYIVVEGNRRLAALKALQEPMILDEPIRRRVSDLRRQMQSPIASVPVTIAPSRRDTDRQIAGRHIGTPVLAWQSENRATFILAKLEEGYSTDELRDELGFSLSDVQGARQTRAIADITRSIVLPPDIKAKIDSPRPGVFSTIERVLSSEAGRAHLHIAPDPDHGLRGTTTATQFLKGFTRLVTDIVSGAESSRTLNTNEDIDSYFNRLPERDRVQKKRGSFAPTDLIKPVDEPDSPEAPPPQPERRSARPSDKVVPPSFKVNHGARRLHNIRNELVRLRRADFPNAGAVLLRVFLELSMVDYLQRSGGMDLLTERLRAKNALRHNPPEMKHLKQEFIAIVKRRLPEAESKNVEKALRTDPAAPFSVDDLHSFVHNVRSIPTDNDIEQFWERTEPLFRLMLSDMMPDDNP